MKPNTPAERLYNGIIKENPTFVLMLGMCPTLAITTSATNGFISRQSNTACTLTLRGHSPISYSSAHRSHYLLALLLQLH